MKTTAMVALVPGATPDVLPAVSPAPRRGSGWRLMGPPPLLPHALAWRRKHLQVIGASEGGGWHVSVVSLRGAVSDDALARVRRDFALEAAEEDTLPGQRARHLWLAGMVAN